MAAMRSQDSLPLIAALILAVGLVLRRRTSDIHKRGVRLLEGGRARSVVRRRRRAWPSSVSLAGVPITAGEETRHFKLIGTTGTGKSTAIAGLLTWALLRGHKGVVADPDGGYPGACRAGRWVDVTTHPVDPPAVSWDP